MIISVCMYIETSGFSKCLRVSIHNYIGVFLYIFISLYFSILHISGAQLGNFKGGGAGIFEKEGKVNTWP